MGIMITLKKPTLESTPALPHLRGRELARTGSPNEFLTDVLGPFLKPGCVRALSWERGYLARPGSGQMAAIPGTAPVLLQRCSGRSLS